MKKISIILCMLFGAAMLHAQQPNVRSNGNYVISRTYTNEMGTQSMADIIYHDGLGYPMQTVQIGAAGKLVNGKYGNIVTPIWYDNMRHSDARTYLPFVSACDTGELEDNAFTKQNSYYSASARYGSSESGYTYFKKGYEASPLNRILWQTNVGSAYQGKNVIFGYQTNTSSDAVCKFRVNLPANTLSRMEPYAQGHLFKTAVTSEDGTTAETFKDFQDRVILERVKNGNATVDTYYVYDDFGRLAWIISPQGSQIIKTMTSVAPTTDVAKQFCYIYTYDSRGRMVERRLPGKEAEYMVYDEGNRLVLSQDGKLRGDNKWVYTVYDNHDRPTHSNIVKCNVAMTRQQVQNRYVMFDNTYPNHHTTPDSDRLFIDGKFSFVSNLSETRYGGYGYGYACADGVQAVEDPRPTSWAPMYSVNVERTLFIKFDFGKSCSTPANVPDYTDENGIIDPMFLMGVLESNHNVCFYYLPIGFEEMANIWSIFKDSRVEIVQNYSSDPHPPILSPSYSLISHLYDLQYLTLPEEVAPFWEMAHSLSTPDRIMLTSVPSRSLTSHGWPFSMPRRPHGLTRNLDLPICQDVVLQTVPTASCGVVYTHTEPVLHSFMPLYFDWSGIRAEFKTPGPEGEYYIPAMYREQLAWVIDGLKYQFRIVDMSVANPISIATVSNPDYGSESLFVVQEFAIPTHLQFQAVGNVVASTDKDDRISGLKLYDKIAVMEGAGASPATTYIERAYYYDYKGRVIQTVEKNHLGGISRTSIKYDFAGNILAQHESHQNAAGATADILVKTFDYDHRGRLLSETSKLNTSPEAKITYAYDELGKLASKTYGTGISAVTETYAYNIQGWLTEQNSTKFNMKLRYYNPMTGRGTIPSYTGNITEWEWNHAPANASAKQAYAFTYDPLARLKESRLFENASKTPSNKNTEQSIDYDRNGNITQLQRYGSTGSLTDNFTYNYTGNRLSNINGTASYTYDLNGNCTTDGLNGWNLEYNALNLVGKVSQGASAKANYRWLADGTKAGVKDGAGTSGYEYLGSLVYQRVNGQLQLESAAFGGGRIIAATGTGGATYAPNYFIVDHLGSTRVVFSPSGSTTQDLARYDYMPFGQSRNATGQASTNRYAFSGKEQQTTGNLCYLDFGARFYDSRIGRWHSIDPLSEINHSLSPFGYCSNNPITRIDHDGNWDVNVHLYNNRKAHGYGIAVVTDRHGNEVYRFNVRAEGVGGRNRMNESADTPLGVYDIPDNEAWMSGGSRKSYGPNHRLVMNGEFGEIIESGRSLIRMHGGRQERFDASSGTWIKVDNAELKKTEGCLRVFDLDIKTFKRITDGLQKNDSEESPGKVTIKDDLRRKTDPGKNNYVEINVTYQVPEAEEEYWRTFMKNTFGVW